MKVFLVRHAKAASGEGLRDFDRPLSLRGYNDAHKMGSFLQPYVKGKIIIVSSPAIRALTTALIFADELHAPKGDIVLNETLYREDAEEWYTTISLYDHENLFIFGHNPVFSMVVSKMAEKGYEDFPTCTVALFSEVRTGPPVTGKLTGLFSPKMFDRR